MDNKNDKTFADLFSSVSSSDHQGNDDFKKETKVENSGNIFDGQDTLNMNSLLKKDTSEKEKTDIDHSGSMEEETPVSFGKVFFDMKDTDSSLDEKENQVVEEKSDVSRNSFSMFDKEDNKEEEHDEANQLSSNIFFEQMNEIDSQQLDEKKIDVVSENTSIEKGNQAVEEKSDASRNSSSIFDKEENKKNEHDEANQLSSSIFFGEMNDDDSQLLNDVNSQQLEEEKEKMVPESSSTLSDENPFFQNTSKSDDSFLSERVDDIFKKNQETPINNPFFQESSSTVQETEKISNSSDVEIQKKVEKSIEPEEPISVSPFFVDNALEEQADSFGIDKINLVENNQIGKNIGTIDTSKSKHFNVKIVKKKEPFVKFILGVISYAIFILLLLIGITLLVYVLDIKIRAAKGDYSAPKFNAYVVLTGSMLPAIQVKDVVVTKKIEPSKLEVGDVITFASADTRFLNTVITHRIIKKSYDAKSKTYSFQTMGDNNNVADGALVPQNNIFGKVILKIPKLGYLQEFLATDGGWILVILVPCLTVISYDIVKLIKGLKRKKYKNITVQR